VKKKSGRDARFLIFAPENWRKSTCLGALSRVYAPRPKRPSAMTAALSFLMIDELGILPQSSIKRSRRSRATLVESAMKLPIRGTSLCRISSPHAVRC
jgi:hypothetical protein